MEQKLLIVDDEPSILRALSRLLTFQGYKVITAKNGQEGLALLEEESIPVIISDQRMPKMSGSEFLAQVKLLYPQTIRLMLSGYADFKAVTDAINDSDIYKFMNKPWEEEELLTQITDAFEKYHIYKEQAEELAYGREIDRLTKLASRDGFSKHLSKLISNAKKAPFPIAVLFLNINRFREINNALGNKLGDLTLQTIANRLKDYAVNGELVARLSNDEFAILVTGPDAEEKLKNYLENLEHLFDAPITVEGRQLKISTQIGFSLYPKDGSTGAELMQNANTALYQAKQKNNGQAQHYDASMKEITKKRLILEHDLDAAIKKEQFISYFQPQMDLSTNKINGLEALIRWQHPTLGIILPNDFISLFEETGSIVRIEKQIIKKNISLLKRWQNENGLTIPISLNLSPKEFADSRLIDFVSELLSSSKIPPELIEFEVTESLILDNFKRAERLLNALHGMGVKLALDDFGTGYSSINYLTHLPFDTIKIDRSFTRHIVDNKKTQIALSAMLNLCKNLSMKTIVEGVETKEQIELLRTHTCDAIQGYWLSQPIPESNVITFLAEHEKNYNGR